MKNPKMTFVGFLRFPHDFRLIRSFTLFDSTRGPEEVFVLLQTVYQGFDDIAKRRKVFKVETIGDCYLAATGLVSYL